MLYYTSMFSDHKNKKKGKLSLLFYSILKKDKNIISDY